MVRIGPVWDSTTAVLAGRAGLIAPIAFAAFFVPPALQNAARLALSSSRAGMMVGAVLALVAALGAIWGQLAVMAVATDPATTVRDAARQATARLLPALGVVLVITVVAMLLIVPLFVLLAASGVDLTRLAMASGTPATLPALSVGTRSVLAIYLLVLVVLGLWVSARFVLTYAVVLNERRALGAIGRSVTLTRGSTWRLIGVLALFGIVLSVAMFAAQAVVGLAARLVMGAEHLAGALFVAGLAGSAVATVLLAIAYVFVARAYVFAREGDEAHG